MKKEALETISKEEFIEQAHEQVAKVTVTPAKPYTFRLLNATDVFPMFTIISKIGVNEFTACFGKDGIKDLIKQMTGKKEGEKQGEEQNAAIVGISVALEIANVIFANLQKAEKDIYQLLSQASNLTVEEVQALGFAEFAEMVIDFIKKDEFADFIKVVSKLFK